jgi:uncharacterized membrane protein
MSDTVELRKAVAEILHQALPQTIDNIVSEISDNPALAGAVGAGVGAAGGAALGGEHKLRNAAIGAGIGGGVGAAAATDAVQTRVGKGLAVLMSLIKGNALTPAQEQTKTESEGNPAATGSNP